MSIGVVRALLGAAVLALTTATSAFAQQNDTAELSKEIKLLRQAIETIVAANIRVQIVFGRLQIQEQRTVSATQRLEVARKKLNELMDQIAQMDVSLKRQDEAAANSQDAEQREMYAAVKRDTAVYRARLDVQLARAQAEEAEAANCLALEQGQWSDLNRQLEDLERSLASRSR